MEKLKELLEEIVNEELREVILSNPVTKEGVSKIKIRPVLLKEEQVFQWESFRETKVFHENLSVEDTKRKIVERITEFKQLQLETSRDRYMVLISKKGKVTISQKRKEAKEESTQNLSHNRKKKYLLEEGKEIPFLRDLGVMTKEGKIVNKYFDKYRQINRFLEFIEDVKGSLPKDKEITIVDFGCGKSYLTFAIYYYLHEIQNYDVKIIGLDLKADVIQKCNRLAQSYGYEKLHFLVGNIEGFSYEKEIDMVISLHACDTATDYALVKAVDWNAKVILSVPCCQHELNGQIKNEILEPILKYGLIKERVAALVTDALRAGRLEEQGYKVQILEFIDMEHTPKNILIRAVKGNVAQRPNERVNQCEEFLQVKQALGKLLNEQEEGLS